MSSDQEADEVFEKMTTRLSELGPSLPDQVTNALTAKLHAVSKCKGRHFRWSALHSVVNFLASDMDLYENESVQDLIKLRGNDLAPQ